MGEVHLSLMNLTNKSLNCRPKQVSPSSLGKFSLGVVSILIIYRIFCLFICCFTFGVDSKFVVTTRLLGHCYIARRWQRYFLRKGWENVGLNSTVNALWLVRAEIFITQWSLNLDLFLCQWQIFFLRYRWKFIAIINWENFEI